MRFFFLPMLLSNSHSQTIVLGKKARSALPKLILEVLYNRFIIWQHIPNSVKTRNREVPSLQSSLIWVTDEQSRLHITHQQRQHSSSYAISISLISLPLMAIAAASSLPLGNHSHLILFYILLRADAFEMILVVTELRICRIPISICMF